MLLVCIEQAALFGQRGREYEQRNQLRGECLGGSDADLRASARVEHQPRGARNGAFLNVADGQRMLMAERPGMLERLHRVQRLAGIAKW